jgi:hypothetical protein
MPAMKSFWPFHIPLVYRPQSPATTQMTIAKRKCGGSGALRGFFERLGILKASAD